jgi:hypothetical protein
MTSPCCCAQGLEWVAKNHIKPAVVHMSVEGSFSSVVNKAVEQLMRTHHVHVVVSSGDLTALADNGERVWLYMFLVSTSRTHPEAVQQI